MKPKFSPKFTLITNYPMMFSSTDLRYIESEMIDVILNPKISKSTPNVDSASHREPLETSSKDATSNQDSIQIDVFRQQLEHIWVIEAVEFLKQGLKSREKT